MLDDTSDRLQIDVPERNRNVLKSRIAVLRRFDAVFAAIRTMPDTATQPDSAGINVAAAELAEYLDDPNAALAESTRLWQAAAYWRAGNSERALKILRPIVSDPVHARIGLVSRLFRVRLLAQNDQHAAALAHCNRIADRVDRWFADYSERTRESARLAVRAVQISIYEDWAAYLKLSASDETGPAAIAGRLAELKKDFTPPDASSRFRLKSLIGGLGPIKLPQTRPAATTQPAD